MSFKTVSLHSKSFHVHPHEFPIDYTLTPLEIKTGLSELDREIAFINQLAPFASSILNIGASHGAYVASTLSTMPPWNSKKRSVAVVPVDQSDRDTIARNLSNLSNVHLDYISSNEPIILRIENTSIQLIFNGNCPLIITPAPIPLTQYQEYRLGELYVYVRDDVTDEFNERFSPVERVIGYDNLLKLAMIVKNAGDGFRQVLRQNKPYIDSWTILDTGSTDNTVQIIHEELADVPGELFQEPFVDFKTTRNRCLDLAGTDSAFIVMLDDTYVLEGTGLRSFLTRARGDDIMDSYSLYIQDESMVYSSNRVTKPARKLRYIHRVHEIIQPNMNGAISKETACIRDIPSPYMQQRTRERKQADLVGLFQDLADDPLDTRSIYYIAETYLNMGEHVNAFIYYSKCSKLDGFKEEKQDALYKMAVLSQFNLGVSWPECRQMYLDCFEFDKTRPEALFMIGHTLLQQDNKEEAYPYLLRARQVGIPTDCCMNIRMHIYKGSLLSSLIPLLYEHKEFSLGLECARDWMNGGQTGHDTTAKNWYHIFEILEQAETKRHEVKEVSRISRGSTGAPVVVAMVIGGGWNLWDGETYDNQGIGGSETCVIKFSEWLSNMGYEVTVFCNCPRDRYYKGVKYQQLINYPAIVASLKPSVCIVHRYPEYIPLNVLYGIPTYLMLHDVITGHEVFVNSPYFKGIICISDWQRRVVADAFRSLSVPISVTTYGIDLETFPVIPKVKYSFIFSSFPNRGLLQLLQMFPEISRRYPQAHLHVFCDTTHSFVRKWSQSDMEQIDKLLAEQKGSVTNHGWVNKATLKHYWAVSHVWLYPCVFSETFCLTALEAAASKTLIVTTDLAALTETVGDRGVMIPGDAKTVEWQRNALDKLFMLLENEDRQQELIDTNYKWAQERSYNKVVEKFADVYLGSAPPNPL